MMTTCEISRIEHPYYKWVTLGESKWVCENGEVIIVPAGFLSDGSSGGPDIGFSWLFHDYLYATHKIGDRVITRKEADKVMASILRWERASLYRKAFVIVSRVNPFWLFSRAWKSSGKRGPEFLIPGKEEF